MPTQDHLLRRTYSSPMVIVLFLALAGVSTAQVSIKERVGIRPSSSALQGVSSVVMNLGPISFSLGECGSLEGNLDSRYNDRIFVPRDGGTVGISFDSRYGRAVGDSSTCPDTLLVFDQSGALVGVYSFQPEQYERVNMWGMIYDRPRIQQYLPVRQWEPLRFRLLTRCCECPSSEPSVIVPPNVDSEDSCFSTYRTHFPVLYDPYVLDGDGGELIFRTGVRGNPRPPCYQGDDFASRFPMEYIQYDPNANGPMPPVESDFPIEVSVTGPYRLVITWANSEVDDFLRMLQPRDTLLFSNVTAHQGETISLGTLTAGTLVQFTNSRGFVCRMPLGGPRWALTFESGTDLRFDEFEAQFEFDAGYPDHLEVRAESDTVWYGDTVAVSIMPADDQGRLSPLADDSLFQYSIELLAESQPYATLRYNGVTSPLVEHIPSTGAVGRGVQLILSGAEPESTVTLQFHLKVFYLGEILPTSVRTSVVPGLDSIGKVMGRKQDLEGKGIRPRATQSSVHRRTLSNGAGEVVMENDWSLVEKSGRTLRILDHDPWTIWPWLPPAQRASIGGYNPQRSFEIQVLNGLGQPVKDESVAIRTEFVPMSGGHDHNDLELPLTQQGAFYGQENSDNPLVLTTDASGRAVVDSFVASPIAGRYIVTASLVAASAIRDTVNLTVAVPGLELLPEGQNYVKIGGTCDHHGPSDKSLAEVPANCRTPDNDHWVASSSLASLDSAALAFREDQRNRTGLMRLNDVSLPFGGLFDIAGRWRTKHDSHRTGRDVDIENINLSVLRRNMRRYGWKYIYEGAGFYPHFRYQRQD
jgi:hypothetical protein